MTCPASSGQSFPGRWPRLTRLHQCWHSRRATVPDGSQTCVPSRSTPQRRIATAESRADAGAPSTETTRGPHPLLRSGPGAGLVHRAAGLTPAAEPVPHAAACRQGRRRVSATRAARCCATTSSTRSCARSRSCASACSAARATRCTSTGGWRASVGPGDAKIAALEPGGDPRRSTSMRALVTATSPTRWCTTSRPPTRCSTRCAARLTTRALAELVLTIGFYMMVSRFLENFEVDIEPPGVVGSDRLQAALTSIAGGAHEPRPHRARPAPPDARRDARPRRPAARACRGRSVLVVGAGQRDTPERDAAGGQRPRDLAAARARGRRGGLHRRRSAAAVAGTVAHDRARGRPRLRRSGRRARRGRHRAAGARAAPSAWAVSTAWCSTSASRAACRWTS